MAKPAVTLFTWGYEGWGNWTDELVAAVDAVERSRGWGRPLFVDVRASRKVRAEGFREAAFERRFGARRYRWVRELGNRAILTGGRRATLIDPTRAVDLLDLAVGLRPRRRRVIYFCSCASPSDRCHRHLIAPYLLRQARARRQPVTIVEWPGYESDPTAAPRVRTSPEIVRAVNAGRGSVPLRIDRPRPQLLALPWLTMVDLVDSRTGRPLDFMLTGPAQHRAGGWFLPVLAGVEGRRETLRLQRRERERLLALPRSWPARR